MSDENTNGDNQAAGNDWRTALPEQIREWPEVAQADTAEGFWKRISDQRSHIGNSIRIPTEDASDEQWGEFHTKILNRVPALMRTPTGADDESTTQILRQLGAPEKAEGYAAADAAESLGENELAFYREAAHEAGLTRKQFDKVIGKLSRRTSDNKLVAEQQHKDELKGLADEWGLAAEAKYQNVVGFAKSVNAPETLVNALESKQVDAATVRWLASISTAFKESSIPSSDPFAGKSMTPSEASAQINDILFNKEHPYHKGDRAAKEKMHELMKFANPQKYG